MALEEDIQLKDSEIVSYAQEEMDEYMKRILDKQDFIKVLETPEKLEILPMYEIDYKGTAFELHGYAFEVEPKLKGMYKTSVEYRYFLTKKDNPSTILGFFSALANIPDSIGSDITMNPLIVVGSQGEGHSTTISAAMQDFIQELTNRYQKPVKVDLIDENGKSIERLRKRIHIIETYFGDDDPDDGEKLEDPIELRRKLYFKVYIQRPRWLAQFKSIGSEVRVTPSTLFEDSTNGSVFLSIERRENKSLGITKSIGSDTRRTKSETIEYLRSLRSQYIK